MINELNKHEKLCITKSVVEKNCNRIINKFNSVKDDAKKDLREELYRYYEIYSLINELYNNGPYKCPIEKRYKSMMISHINYLYRMIKWDRKFNYNRA